MSCNLKYGPYVSNLKYMFYKRLIFQRALWIELELLNIFWTLEKESVW